jgi:hypothetical protein
VIAAVRKKSGTARRTSACGLALCIWVEEKKGVAHMMMVMVKTRAVRRRMMMSRLTMKIMIAAAPTIGMKPLLTMWILMLMKMQTMIYQIENLENLTM